MPLTSEEWEERTGLPSGINEFEAASQRGIEAMRAEISRRKEETRAAKLTCACCGKEDDEKKPLQACSTCKSVRYCDRTCQTKHYKATHKRDCATFKEPPVCQAFNTKLKNAGSEYPQRPVVAKGYEGALGCWFVPSGNIDCTLQQNAKGSGGEIPETFPEPGTLLDAMKMIPGATPGTYLTSIVLVQNRKVSSAKEGQDLIVRGKAITAVPRMESRRVILEGKKSDDEHVEMDVPGHPGLKQLHLLPVFCKVQHFNGRAIKKGEKPPQMIDEQTVSVLLHPGDYVIYEIQWRVGGPRITYDFQVWDALHHIEVPATIAAPTDTSTPTSPPDNQLVKLDTFQGAKDAVSEVRAQALVDHYVVDWWYGDFIEKGKWAHIESHYGKERKDMLEAGHGMMEETLVRMAMVMAERMGIPPPPLP